MRNFTGFFAIGGADVIVYVDQPLFSAEDAGLYTLNAGYYPRQWRQVNFNPGRVVPTADENRPVSLSVLACISY